MALCESAEIISTKGGVRFDDAGRHSLRTKRPFGSSFTAVIRFTQDDIADCAAAVQSLIVPTATTTTYNGVALTPRTPIQTFKVQLPTEIADAEGNIRPSRRRTTVMIYEPRPGETPALYELGIPVVETGDLYHVDILQKVPLNTDRDNVRPSFLREVRTVVMNEMYDKLTPEDATKPWAQEALGDERLDDNAVEHALTLLYGDKRVAFDPSDPEANSRAVSEGYTVIYGRSLSKEQWSNVRRAGAALPAGQVTPGHHEQTDPNGEPPIPESEWTDGMRRIAAYTEAVGQFLLDFIPTVAFRNNITGNYEATFGQRTITYNIGRLGKAWVTGVLQETLDALILHEFAHHKVSNHLSYEFPDEIARLGAKLRNVSWRL